MIVLCTSENGKEILDFVQQFIKENSVLHTDKSTGFKPLNQCYKDIDGNIVLDKQGNPIKKFNYTIIQEKSDQETNPMKWLHTLISNLKSEIKGIYHGVPPKFLKLYIAEYVWRYNHRGIRSNKEKLIRLIKGAMDSRPITRYTITMKCQ